MIKEVPVEKIVEKVIEIVKEVPACHHNMFQPPCSNPSAAPHHRFLLPMRPST